MQKEFERLLVELEATTEKAELLKIAIGEIKASLAAHCSVAIGDVVVSNCGYSNEGKEMVVDTIVYSPIGPRIKPDKETLFICSGRVLKKDKTLGKQRAKHKCN